MSGKKNIVIERTYRATLDEVWSLWTTKLGFEYWWGPEGFRVDVHALEARAGGALRYDMIAEAPEAIAAMTAMGAPLRHPANARFSKVEPKTHLVVTNIIDFLPGVPPYEADITVDLTPSAASVRMVVTMQAMHDDATSAMQKEGFTSQLTKLDKRFG